MRRIFWTVALLGAGGLLFGLTAVILVNRLVLHPGIHHTGAPAMWIMISPLAVTSLAMQSVAGGDPMLGGTWTPAVAEVATFGQDLARVTLDEGAIAGTPQQFPVAIEHRGVVIDDQNRVLMMAERCHAAL